MSYEKFYPGGWQSGESGGTPITPEALNHIENGIKQTYSDFAPAGYGLGGNSTYVTDVNHAVANGWYYADPHTANIPDGMSGYADIFVKVRADSVVQYIRSVTDNTSLVRYRVDSNSEYIVEWVNPPMIPGVEYRTTERRNGKPIYVKAVNIGAVVNGANTKYTEARYNGAVKVFASADGYLAPYYLNGALAFAVNAEPADGGVHVSLYSNGTFDGIATTVCLWYTKD